MKLNLLTALTLAVLPTIALAANTTVEHVTTVTPQHVGAVHLQRPQATLVPFKNALQFNEIDGQPVR